MGCGSSDSGDESSPREAGSSSQTGGASNGGAIGSTGGNVVSSGNGGAAASTGSSTSTGGVSQSRRDASSAGASGGIDGGKPDASLASSGGSSGIGGTDSGAGADARKDAAVSDGALGTGGAGGGSGEGGAVVCDPVTNDTYTVDPVNGSDAVTSTGSSRSGGNAAAKCAFKTLTHAIAVIGASPARPTTIILDNTPASTASGETFPLQIPPNVTVRGNTASMTVQVPATKTGFVMNGTASALSTLTIDGANTTASRGIAIGSGGGVTLDAVTVQRLGSDGIALTGSGAATISNTVSQGNAGVGLRAGGAKVTLTAVTFTANAGAGFEIASATARLIGTDVVATNNGGGGVLVSAGRADLTGATRVNGNHGGAPVSFGAFVAPGAILTLAGANGAHAQVNGNDGVGIVVLGNFSGAFVDVATNGVQGVWIDTTDAPVFPEGGGTPAQNALFSGCDVRGNGTSPGVYPGGGVTVLRTRKSSVDPTVVGAVQRFLFTQDDPTQDPSRVRDNLGDGVTLGGDPTPTTGLCAILPPPLACGAVDGIVRNSIVTTNQQGVVVQELDANLSATMPLLIHDTIVANGRAGLHVYTSYVSYDPNGNYINGNMIGSNGWGGTQCAGTELEPEIHFDGPVAPVASRSIACSSHNASATACNLDRANTCIWNANIFGAGGQDPCRPSFVLSSSDCSSNFNIVSGYQHTGNPDNVVGVFVSGGAWANMINMSWIHGGNLFESQDWTAADASSFASDGPSGGEQTCTAATNKCPTPP